MNFIEKIVDAIRHPKSAMENISEQPMIEEAVIIVGIYAIASALIAYFLYANKIISVSENIPASMQSIFTIFIIVIVLVSTFLGWIIGTGITHLISMALGGEGKFNPQLMTVAAYSMIPQVFGIIINLALFLVIRPTTNEMSVANSYSIASNLIDIIVKIWSAAIFIFGVQSVHKLTFRKSVIAVAIPLSVSIILAVISMRSNGII